MRPINEIIIHCSATACDKDFRAADIDRWHKDRGFDGIGYHFVIDLDGTVEVGRPIEKAGAHCTGHNANSIGICYIGGLMINGKTPYDSRTNEQKIAMRALVTSLQAVYGISKVTGHNAYANKACPCFQVPEEL